MLPRTQRVNTSLFDKIMKEGVWFQAPHFSFKIIRAREGEIRVAAIVPKKILKTAAKRNYLKRRIYQALRLNLSNVRKPIFGLLFAKKGSETISFEEIRNEIGLLLSRV